MNSIFRFNRLLLLSAILTSANLAASAQSTILPEPFSSLYAGQGNNSTAPNICSGAIPDANNIASNTAVTPNATVVLGDGCLPTQSIIDNIYDTKVDAQGDVYISEENSTITVGTTSYQSGDDIRVIYNGGTALYNALVAASPQIANFKPQIGHIYTLAGSLLTSISSYNGNFYCGGLPALSAGGLIGYNLLGDGCPASLARITPRGIAIDNDGNIIMQNATTHYGARVVYVGGTKMYNLIKLLNPNVIVPQVGYVYALGFNGATGAEGDGALATQSGGVSPRYIAVDSNDDIYLSDGNAPSNGITTSAANIREINGTTGIINTVAGETYCGGSGNTTYNGHNYFPYNSAYGCPYGYSGDGGPATQALLAFPEAMVVDQYNNLYINDYTNARVRVLYQGGILAVLANQGITPVVGNLYTVFGGTAVSGVQGSGVSDNTPAQNVKLGATNAIGLDKAGNLYVQDSSTRQVWRVDAVTGIANIVAGGASGTGAIQAGKFCQGTSGPVSTDAFGSGCPAILSYISANGSITFDAQGNFYLGSPNTYPSVTPNLGVYKFSYNNAFPPTAVGSSSTQYMAFTSAVSNVITTRTFTEQAGATTEFSDAGGTSCAAGSTIAVKGTCIVNVKFTPSNAGDRLAKIAFNTATTTPGTEFISGVGLASEIAIDNGSVSTLGIGLTPSGVAADLLGNVFVADTKGGQLLKGASTGTTLAPLATPVTGLNNPSQVALDNAGDIYIADTGNNRIVVVTSTGTPIINLGTGLSGPRGVAVDQYGDIFVADTGNNRIVQLTLNGNQLPFQLPGLAIPLSAPTQLALDASGDLFVVDSKNSRIVEDVIASGVISPVLLDPNVVPTGLAIDAAGDLYISDATSKSVLDYYAGATPGFGLVTGFVTPVGLAIDTTGNLFTADTGLVGAIELRRSLAAIQFPETNPLQTTTAAITLDNIGNSALHFSAPVYMFSGATPTFFSLAPSTTAGCAAGTAYAAGSSCNFTASFTPAIAPATDSATATLVTDAANTSTSVAQLNGPAVALPVATTTKLVVSPATGVFYSLPVTLTATLVPTSTTIQPGGTFTLTVDGKTEEPPVAVPAGLSYTFSVQLPIGTHALSVTYSGSSPYASSAASITVPVQPAVTTTTLTVTPQSINGVGSLLFSASVAATTAVGQTGTITIWAGPVGTGTILCQGPISGPTAVPPYAIACTESNLNYSPANTFTAVYSGSANGNYLPSQSASVTPPTGDFLVAPVVSTFTVPQGGVGQLNVNVVSLFGSSGSVTTSCSGLPANSVCRFMPNNVALTSDETPQGVLVLINTNVSSSLASNDKPAALDKSARTREIVFAFGLPLGFGLLLLRRRSKLRVLAMFVLGIALAAGTTGCSGTQSLQTFSTLVTPTGTYNLQLIFTGISSTGETAVHSTPATFTVLAAPPSH